MFLNKSVHICWCWVEYFVVLLDDGLLCLISSPIEADGMEGRGLPLQGWQLQDLVRVLGGVY